MVKTFNEWVAAVEKQAAQLRAVSDYLNQDGKERLTALDCLSYNASFCPTALDFWNFIQFEEHPEVTQKLLDSKHITLALRRLGEIADSEHKD